MKEKWVVNCVKFSNLCCVCSFVLYKENPPVPGGGRLSGNFMIIACRSFGPQKPTFLFEPGRKEGNVFPQFPFIKVWPPRICNHDHQKKI
jgi:hypothetical protein